MDVGAQINQYTIIEHIGRGGMADVWSARDTRLSRTVAIKTIARDLAADVDPVALFEREAKTIAGLEHPHILPIYDFGEFEGQLYIVMRYVTGGSLESLVADGPLSIMEALSMSRAIGSALDYAHSKNVIHLDIKPSNILLDSNNSPYLADFGLATVMDQEGRAANPGYGTLLYMAPEQLASEHLDFRADIYAFTILVFHLLTGELPFDATTSLALKQLQSQEDLPDMDTIQPHLPDELTPVLRHGTALSPDNRPASIKELVDELERVLSPQVVTEGDFGQIILLDEEDTDETDQLYAETMNLVGMVTQLTPDQMAKQEAIDLYEKARRAWSHGQGRFLMGITHFMLVSDYYLKAEENNLELDEAGYQILLRGALEYDHEVDYWWDKLDDTNRRWVALHAVRSDNAPARARALARLETLPDYDPPRIPGIVAQQLQVEGDMAAQQAAIHLLEVRASKSTDWREQVYSEEIDELLAHIALDKSQPAPVAEQAARTIGRIRSRAAVRHIADQQRAGHEHALRALAFIRDEAPSLPPEVSQQARLIAWLDNTWRRLSDDPMGIVWRFVFGFLGGFAALSLYAWINLAGPGVLINEKIGKTLSTGITFGIFVGFAVVLAGELPARLRGFWPAWLRLLVGAVLGALAGAVTWMIYAWLLLYLALPTLDGAVLLIGGLGIALGLAIAGAFNLRGWQAAMLTTIILYGFIWFSYNQFFNGQWFSPFLYFTGPETVLSQGVMIAVLIALGGFAQSLWRDGRSLFSRVREQPSQA